MSDDLRRLIADGEKLGFTFAGQKAHGGHLQFIHESGTRITASSTPSSNFAWHHARRDMEKVAGRELPRDKKGHHTFKKTVAANMEVRDAEIVDRLVESADSIRCDFRRLVSQPSRSSAQRARELLDEFSDIQAELATHHRVIDPIY